MQKRHVCIRRTSTGFFWPCLCFFSALWACYLYAASSTNASPREEKMDLRGYLQGEGTNGIPNEDFCADQRVVPTRAKRVSISDFGGIGDGKFLNTRAIGDAIAYLESFGYGGGGGELHIPAGIWLTGSFNVTSHFTLFLDEGAVLLGSQDPKHWPVIDPLPSYGTGRELPGGRHISLIHGENLTDVVITGNNGTVDGQGEIWWRLHFEGKLDFTRGHLLELMHSRSIIISNLTFKDSPFWNIHPVYCSNVLIQNLTILAPIQSPNTDGIDPDSSTSVCIEDCYIENGDDLISIKSGWDEHGTRYGAAAAGIAIRRVSGGTRESAGISLGSEMSGGVSGVYIADVEVHHAHTGIRVKSGRGRGGYVRDVHVSGLVLANLRTAIGFTDLYSGHPDTRYDPSALPSIGNISISNVVGRNISNAGDFHGLPDSPFHDIYLRNITLDVSARADDAWKCSYVHGYSDSVLPLPCPSLRQSFA